VRKQPPKVWASTYPTLAKHNHKQLGPGISLPTRDCGTWATLDSVGMWRTITSSP